MSTSLQSANLMDSIWAEQRKFEALKLYYRVLKAICRAEAQILHAMLERTGITAFDLSKSSAFSKYSHPVVPDEHPWHAIDVFVRLPE
ncbi:retinoblastoma-related protein [Quercus suber]|uniref:Retinoblastoma-related protein n=1 Tax=Quercus suber TaxID=58331 RepID=A0AAW0J758_QUESU